ncbi:hypothetical protein Tco_0314628 [Tanacetum coccineum]
MCEVQYVMDDGKYRVLRLKNYNPKLIKLEEKFMDAKKELLTAYSNKTMYEYNNKGENVRVSSGGPSHSPSWKEDSFEINVLPEESEREGTSARSSGAARDEAGPSRQDYVVLNRS